MKSMDATKYGQLQLNFINLLLISVFFPLLILLQLPFNTLNKGIYYFRIQKSKLRKLSTDTVHTRKNKKVPEYFKHPSQSS